MGYQIYMREVDLRIRKENFEAVLTALKEAFVSDRTWTEHLESFEDAMSDFGYIPEYDENGQIVSITTKSTSYGIAAAEKVMADYGVVPTWDETVGQYFVQFEADGKVYKIWWEEERSIELKLKLMEEYELAGVSFWKLGRERSQTWDVIEQYLRK